MKKFGTKKSLAQRKVWHKEKFGTGKKKVWHKEKKVWHKGKKSLAHRKKFGTMLKNY